MLLHTVQERNFKTKTNANVAIFDFAVFNKKKQKQFYWFILLRN